MAGKIRHRPSVPPPPSKAEAPKGPPVEKPTTTGKPSADGDTFALQAGGAPKQDAVRSGLTQPGNTTSPSGHASATPPEVAVDVVEAASLAGPSHSATLGNAVAKSALGLKGKLNWTLPAMNASGRQNDFEDFIRKESPLKATANLNCWEAVIFSAMESGVLDPASVHAAFKENIYTDFQYNNQVEDWMCGEDPRPYDSPDDAKPGDVILFYGTAHVALSLGGDRVMSLWDGPDGDSTFQETTITALKEKVEANDVLLVNSLKAAITGGNLIGDGDMEAMYDAVCDYDDLLKERGSSPVARARARTRMQEAVGDTMGVQVASSPWERIQELAADPKEY